MYNWALRARINFEYVSRNPLWVRCPWNEAHVYIGWFEFGDPCLLFCKLWSLCSEYQPSDFLRAPPRFLASTYLLLWTWCLEMRRGKNHFHNRILLDVRRDDDLRRGFTTTCREDRRIWLIRDIWKLVSRCQTATNLWWVDTRSALLILSVLLWLSRNGISDCSKDSLAGYLHPSHCISDYSVSESSTQSSQTKTLGMWQRP
jgi:hypothetical protein